MGQIPSSWRLAECADRVYPRDLSPLREKLARAAADAPLTAPGMAYGHRAYDQTPHPDVRAMARRAAQPLHRPLPRPRLLPDSRLTRISL
jgi:hypothetical protein